MECGHPVPALLTDVGRGNLVVTTCSHCALVSDKYVEYEYTILCLNLILCKIGAYRHLIFNSDYGRTRKSLVHLTLLVSLLDASLTHCEDFKAWCCQTLHSLLLFTFFTLGCQSVMNVLNLKSNLSDTFRALLLSSIAKLGAPMMLVWYRSHRKFPEFYMNLIFLFTYVDNCMAVRALTSAHKVLSLFVVLGGVMLAHIADVIIAAFV